MNPKSPPRTFPTAGVALLPTLLVLSLLTIVVVLFFSLARIQLQSSGDHAAGYDLKHLQDTAVNLALGQIRAGSTEPDALWISQPGAIRTFAKNSGVPSAVYKLYSAPEMRVPAASLTTPSAANLESDVPPDWNSLPASFADLNAPSIRAAGTIAFPIVDPRALDTAGGSTPEGFSFSASHAAGGGQVPGVISSGDPSELRLPMPVAWIYILADGSLGTLDASSIFAPFVGQRPASAQNPIVGRIAFWTDDESAKVNINTASEAIFWDTPRAATPEDIAYAKAPPTKNEVQRFGGHPATTCLSSVLLPGVRPDPADAEDADLLREIYSMVPRVSASGGILGGGGPVTFDDDRLYPTIDEFLLDPDHVEQPFFAEDPERLHRLRFFLTANSRSPEITASGAPRVCLWPIFWDDRDTHRTSFDRLAAFCSTLGGRVYHFRRSGALTNIGEYNTFYQDQRSNADLFRYIVNFANKTAQGYPLSMAAKYDPPGTHKTDGRLHNIASGIISFLEFIRQTNLHDTTIAASGNPVVPYAGGWNNRTWGTEIYGQVTNIAMNHLPSHMHTNLKGNTSEIVTNGLGREFLASEVGLAFALAAEHRPDGSKFNGPLVDILELPVGFKAIQCSPIFEGFNPAQGYAMCAPSSSARIQRLDSLRLKSTAGTHFPQGKIDPATSVRANLSRQASPEYYWGTLTPSTPWLRNKAPGDSTTESIYSAADWWVGWGGSGGRYIYLDTNSTNWSISRPTNGDVDDPTRKYPTVYSRGFFIVPSADTELTLSTTNSKKELYFEIGNQRDGDFASHVTRFLLPDTVIPVPEEPASLEPTFGLRYKKAVTTKFTEPEVIDENDVVRTWISRHGDHRLTYVREREEGSVPSSQFMFVPHPDWDPANPTTAEAAKSKKQIHSFTLPGGTPEPGATFKRGLVRGVSYPQDITPDFTIDPDTDPKFSQNRPAFPGGPYPYALDPTETRDWDTGTGIAPDGAYWNKIDDVAKQWQGTIPPYFAKHIWDGSSKNAFDETTAPNQQIPSAAIFGSINSAAFSGLQWTTYLFRPDITPGGHLGAPDNSIIKKNAIGAPPDHAILDWFWMPVVQPYAVSEPFSTAGKINMNFRTAPFSYIRRATGLHAVLKSERLLAIPTSAGPTYKSYPAAAANSGWRQPIDAAKTLIQWDEKFDSGQFFKSPSEVCELFLVPENKPISATDATTLRSSMKTFWDAHKLTGDNVLERPYANIYPRLTTRSNSYRVHFLVQTLQKARSTDPASFDPERDLVTGESQGDALLERSVDPNDPALLTDDYDFIGNSAALPLDNLYTYRVRHIRPFTK